MEEQFRSELSNERNVKPKISHNFQPLSDLLLKSNDLLPCFIPSTIETNKQVKKHGVTYIKQPEIVPQNIRWTEEEVN